MRIVGESNAEDQSVLASLNSIEQELLKVIYSAFAGQLFDDAQFMKLRIQGYSGAEHLLMFITLRQKGKIRAVMKSWGEKLYYIPIEKLPRLHQVCYEYNPQEVSTEIRIIKEAKPGLVLDIFHVLAFIAQDQLLLSVKGIIHKKSIQKMEERIHLKVEDLNQLTLQLPHAEDAPLHIAFILDMLECLKLVRKELKKMVVQEKYLSIWLSMNTEEMTSVLVKIISERYGSYDANMQHLYCLISQPALLSGQWVELELLIEWMVQEQLLDSSRTLQITTRAIAWVSALAAFGWMDVGTFEDDRSCFRWKISADQVLNALFYDTVRAPLLELDTAITSKFYVQPDFEIMVLPDVPYLVRFKLSMFTDLIKNDCISIYKLTKGSISQSIQRGLGVTEIISFISANCVSEVPVHVFMTLEQWDREMKRTHVVSHSSEGKICLENSSADDEQEIEGVEGQYLIHEDYSRYSFQMEDELPTPRSLFPDLEQIPIMWRKDFRSYHFSTVRQMMEQAIKWKTKVKLSLDDSEVDFIPFKITYNPDIISGEVFNPIKMKYEVIELTFSDWKEMRIMIPDFN
jgi:hypothetical protein